MPAAVIKPSSETHRCEEMGCFISQNVGLVTDFIIFMDRIVDPSPVQFGDLSIVPMIVLLALPDCKLQALDEAVPENSAPRRLGGIYL